MSELLCTGPLSVESEFQQSLTGACGPNATGAAIRSVSGNATTPSTWNVFEQMRLLGQGDANGVSNLSQLQKTVAHMGYQITTPNAGESVAAFCARLAGHAPLVLEVANGQAFRDAITGQGEDATGLQYHFVCVLGRNTGGVSARAGGKSLPVGYWVADGDSNVQNPIVAGKRVHRGLNSDLVYYTDTTLAAAKPYGAFAVTKQAGSTAGGGGGSMTTTGVPTGWKDNGTTLLAPNGVPVVHGFRDYVLAHSWDANNYPLAAEAVVASVEPGNAAIGAGSRQDFRLASLGWTQARNVYVIYVGQDIRALEQQLAAALAHVSALEAQLAAVPAPVPPTPPDPIAAQALDVLTRMKALFGEL